MHGDAVVENGVGLTTKDFNVMSQIHECLCEVACVHTLAANVRFPSVCEVRNPQWTIWVIDA